MFEEALQTLRRAAAEQGFVTLNDVDEAFKDLDDEGKEELLQLLEAAGVRVLDDSRLPDPDGESLQAGDLVGIYLRQLDETPLLMAEEEVELAQQIETAEDARRRLESGSVGPQEEQALQARVRQGDEARRHFIAANTRLVVSIAKRYRGQGVPFSDLVQEGNLGLIKAVERFDWRRGFKFSTYATWWIRQAVQRGVASQRRTVRLPSHIGDRLRQLRKREGQLTQDQGREPTAADLAGLTRWSVEEVEWLKAVSRPIRSLDAPLGNEEGDETTLSQLLPDLSQPQLRDLIVERLLQQDVERLLESLSAREARIIELRFGLNGRRPHTLREVGRKFQLTRERIRQIEKEALARLRYPSRSAFLKDYDA